ncbi:MAG TPA: hypothetical protein DD624_02370 [Alphaproteobacteria bacterium]|nr:hypothetical protein [Alphaproteobacteria bacterium]
MKKLLISLLTLSLVAACSKSDEQEKAKAEVEQAKPAPCAPIPALPRQIKLNPEQYKPFEGTGDAELFGKLCIDVDGGQECLANQLVVLNPATDYSEEWFVRNWTKNEPLEEADPIALQYNKQVRTDKDGNFVFKGLQPGSYYVGAVACPCEAANQKQNANFKLQRYGAKASTITKSEVVLRKVFETAE